MERIGFGGVGISRASSNHHISSIVVNSSSRSKFSGKGGAGWAPRLPVSLSTIVIDRVPRHCLTSLRPKRGNCRTSSRRGIRPPSGVAAASLTAVSPVEPSCVQASDGVCPRDSPVDDHGNHNPQTRRRSRTRDAPRRKRKSGVAAVGEGDSSTSSTNSDPELQRLAEALESAYNKNAETNESDYESILKDLEAQTRLVGGIGGAVEAAASCSAPTMSSVGKRRGRPPRARTADAEQQQSPSVVSPQTTKDGFVVRSKPSVVVKRRAGDVGKCRLNLMSRIALRKRKQDRTLQVNNARTTIGKPGQDIWSEEAERLIVQHGVALDLGVVDWNHLKRGLLSADEESELAFLLKPVKVGPPRLDPF